MQGCTLYTSADVLVPVTAGANGPARGYGYADIPLPLAATGGVPLFAQWIRRWSASCLLGHPSAPAISLRGEAWTGIAEQRPFLVWAVALIAAACAYAMRQRLGVAIALGTTALLVPCLAFNAAGEAAILVAGHAGELAFATYCFYLAVTGGHTGTPQERTASAMAGALLQFVNLRLCLGLIFSAEAREQYATNGSLGLVNDYLRLADDVFGCSLPTVAGVMLLVGILPLSLGVALGWRKLAHSSTH